MNENCGDESLDLLSRQCCNISIKNISSIEVVGISPILGHVPRLLLLDRRHISLVTSIWRSIVGCGVRILVEV